MSYLVCEKCRNYYWLEEGESPDDYSNTCDCGGKLNFYEHIPLKIVYKCLKCGFGGRMGSSDRPSWLFCPQCKFQLYLDNICPICGFNGKKYKQYTPNHGTVYKCPNCENSFGIYINKEKLSIGESIISNRTLILGTLRLIVMLIVAILIFKKQFFP